MEPWEQMANDLHSRPKALHKQKDSAGVQKENGC